MIKSQKDFFSGLMFTAAGVAFAVGAQTYTVGTAARMGPGYFPFYIGLLLVLGAAKVLFDVVRQWKRESMTDAFATHKEIGLVLKMFIPTVVYVAVIFVLGLYVASALFIAFFMIWQGQYKPLKAGLVGIAVPAALFALFEIWFLLPLPKGPVEALFGY